MSSAESNLAELPEAAAGEFTAEQKEYLQGFLAGVAGGSGPAIGAERVSWTSGTATAALLLLDPCGRCSPWKLAAAGNGWY